VQTLKGIRMIKQHIPGVRTILGLSNISFGLDPYPRQILNSVYLATRASTASTPAIVHASKIIPLHKLDDEDKQVTLEDLIFDRRREGYDPLFRRSWPASPARSASRRSRSNDENRCRSRTAEEAHRRRQQERHRQAPRRGDAEAQAPLDIINDVLLDGMKVVGELFGSGARCSCRSCCRAPRRMKAAVAHLQPHMEKVEGEAKGTMVLATVRGDVHDIGKNLVDIILSNNGYTRRQPRHQGADRADPRGGEGAQGRRDRHERAAGEVDRGDEGEPRADEPARHQDAGDLRRRRRSTAALRRAGPARGLHERPVYYGAGRVLEACCRWRRPRAWPS
jgi:hypothetical protein